MGVEDALGAGQLSVFLCDARGDAIREQYHLAALLDRHVDGIIVVAATAAARESLGNSIPVPVVYAYGPSKNEEDMSVVTDNVHAGEIGIDHLLAAGRTKIAYAGGDSSYQAARQRAEGAADALARVGLQFVAGPLFGPWNEAWGRQAARMLLKATPDLDAIMCGSDQIARGVLDELRETNHAVPEQVAVLGHDNWQIFATQARPPLTTIDMNFEELGRTAAQLLFDALAGKPRPGTHTIHGSVVPRGSTI
jgi:LacI family transcriptional regulator